MVIESYWNKALLVTEEAIRNGSLVPLKTTMRKVKGKYKDTFEIRSLVSPTPPHIKSELPKVNAFKPWDKRLEIEKIGRDHVLILNKYPIEKGHMLLITSNWAPQSGWLTLNDWEALTTVDNDTQGLWFFNSSPPAGASQPHRHIQLLRRIQNESLCPRENWFTRMSANNKDENDILQTSCKILLRKNTANISPPVIYSEYIELCKKMGIGNPKNSSRPLSPYNLLITRKWISIIRRAKDSFMGFNINALGFAGYLLCTENSDLKWLEHNYPETILEAVSEPYSQ